MVGLAQASRTGAAGTTLAAAGLVLSLAALALLGLRFAGVDTAFGDAMAAPPPRCPRVAHRPRPQPLTTVTPETPLPLMRAAATVAGCPRSD